jgi:hypothetical protein
MSNSQTLGLGRNDNTVMHSVFSYGTSPTPAAGRLGDHVSNGLPIETVRREGLADG